MAGEARSRRLRDGAPLIGALAAAAGLAAPAPP